MSETKQEPSAVEYAAMRLCAYIDARERGVTRDWRFIPTRERNAAMSFAQAMKQAAIEP